MDILYIDNEIIVCIKPARVLSTDEPGGLPELLRHHLGTPDGDIRTVHRLDRVVSGVMVLARTKEAASELSRQIREDEFQKEYLAVVHGTPDESNGTYIDLLGRDKARKMTYVSEMPGKGLQEAVLRYYLQGIQSDLSKVRIELITGRTHQIRVQFSSRGMPLVGERKYAVQDDPCEIALWSHSISFIHPSSGEHLSFTKEPPQEYPWSLF